MNLSRRSLLTGLCIVAVVGATAVRWWRSANIGPVQRGADVALAQGCQSCHGGLGESPLLPRSFAELDAVDEGTLREWILDGMPRRAREDGELRAGAAPAEIQEASRAIFRPGTALTTRSSSRTRRSCASGSLLGVRDGFRRISWLGSSSIAS